MVSEPVTEILLATTNLGKVKEIQDIFASLDLSISPHSPKGGYPPETAATYLGNALIKARACAKERPDCYVLADDSGLEVNALDGAPGVKSARFAAENATDSDNLNHLLQCLSDVPYEQRQAQFVCTIVCLIPPFMGLGPTQSKYLSAVGTLPGSISVKSYRGGDIGFGYDPIFRPKGSAATLAQVSPWVKNQMSHRAQALQQMKVYLGKLLHRTQ